MRSDQGEPGHAVVEGGAGPTSRGMAISAVLRLELRTGLGMYRSRGLVPLRQMAIRVPALLKRRRQCVIARTMASCASHISVSLRERKSCYGMVKPLGIVPTVPRWVASRTLRHREPGGVRRMSRVIRLLPRLQVAVGVPTTLQLCRQIIVATDMASFTGDTGVPQG